MKFFQKRGRLRRVSVDRSRPLPGRVAPPLTPPGKGAARFVITLLFIIVGIAVLNYPSAGPQLKVGDVAPRDLRARTQFKMPDEEATRRERELAQQRALRVFEERTGEIEHLPWALKAYLQAVIQTSEVSDLVRKGPSQKWGTTDKDLLILKNELTNEWLQKMPEEMEKALAQAVKLGIMDDGKRQAELLQAESMSERYEFLARGVDEAEPERRFVTMTLGYPKPLRDFLASSASVKGLLEGHSEEFQKVFLDAVTFAAKPTLTLDTHATEAAMAAAAASVTPRTRMIQEKSILLGAGEKVTRETLGLIETEDKAYRKKAASISGGGVDYEWLAGDLRRGAGLAGLFLGGLLLLFLYAREAPTDVFSSNTRIFGYCAVFLLALGCARGLEYAGFSLQWAPMALTVMFFTVTMGGLPAFGTSALLAILIATSTGGGLAVMLPLCAGSAAAILKMRKIRRRTHVLEAGLVAGVAQAVAVWALWLAQSAGRGGIGMAVALPYVDSAAALGGGMLAGFIFSAALPYVERLFDIATDLRLLEWTDQNQPLLRKLAMEAPGTYHHSTVVSNMAEVAAERIGANALLARAGGYLHDVGKLTRPGYFVENTNGQLSPHEQLSPMLSTLILTAHTKDGVELAAAYGVPMPLRRIIGEHHGTFPVEYFYKKALKESGETGNGSKVRLDYFRYRGSKPRSPEAGIVMLADSSESAARSMENASPARIEQLVHDIVERRLKDGQLDETRMNITEIRAVEASLARSLTAISHPRIRYPAS